MGPHERAAVALVAQHVWPGNPTSLRLARAVLLAGRALDGGPGWYPYAGSRQFVHDRLVRQLRACGPTWDSLEDRLEAFRAEIACRPVLGCSPRHRLAGCGRLCHCGTSLPGTYDSKLDAPRHL